MTAELRGPGVALYRISSYDTFAEYVATTPGTRRIVNVPSCIGVEYTSLLTQSCADVLKLNGFGLRESDAHVVNILRGGLNYGLRDALYQAFGWNLHATCFLSAQRVNDGAGKGWHIAENGYRKLDFADEVSLLIGDVVATGTSLLYALKELVDHLSASGKSLRRIVFFTFGGERATDILGETDARCRRLFPGYDRTVLVYFEGKFAMATSDTPVTIRIPDTDLMRLGAVMAPEFIASQYEDPAYPIERCIIYDAGSRAFSPSAHLRDVKGYWMQTLDLAHKGMTYVQLLHERFPELDPRRFDAVDLTALCERILQKLP